LSKLDGKEENASTMEGEDRNTKKNEEEKKRRRGEEGKNWNKHFC